MTASVVNDIHVAYIWTDSLFSTKCLCKF